MIGFENKNVNPFGRKTGDCVIRAISVATGEPYEKIYRELFEISLKTGYILNEKRVEDRLLSLYGFVKYKQPKKRSGKKFRIYELDALIPDFARKNPVVVVRCARHLTVIKDGKVVDTWDCRGRCVSNFYILE